MTAGKQVAHWWFLLFHAFTHFGFACRGRGNTVRAQRPLADTKCTASKTDLQEVQLELEAMQEVRVSRILFTYGYWLTAMFCR
jgi:hypothetical protein